MWGCFGAARACAENGVLKSGAPRLIDRRSERLRGAKAIGAATLGPQQSGLEHDSGRPRTLGRRRSSTLCWRAQAGTPSLTITRADKVRGPFGRSGRTRAGLIVLRELDQLLLREGRAGSRSRGVLGHPSREGLLVRGACAGALRSFFDARASSRAGSPAAHARGPVRAAIRPDGASRLTRRRGEGSAAASGREKHLYAPFLFNSSS